jgi:hypothetical protein
VAITDAWNEISKSWLGVGGGKHCHWCEHIICGDGAAVCGNKESPLHDGDRIRSWDGSGCAGECAMFKLDPHYEDDANLPGQELSDQKQ